MDHRHQHFSKYPVQTQTRSWIFASLALITQLCEDGVKVQACLEPDASWVADCHSLPPDISTPESGGRLQAPYSSVIREWQLLAPPFLERHLGLTSRAQQEISKIWCGPDAFGLPRMEVCSNVARVQIKGCSLEQSLLAIICQRKA